MNSFAELPCGWATAKLGDLGSWGSGGTPSRSNKAYYEHGTIPWLVIGDLNESVVYRAATCITEEGLKNSSAKLLPAGTLLVAMYGSIGKTAITGVQCATNQAIAYCQPHEGINLNYLHRMVQWLKPGLVAQGKGGTQQNISQGLLKSLSVPLAPSNEQRRIADKLDRVLARVDAANEHLSRVAPLIKRFRQSVLAAATSGRLTEDWRKHDKYKTTTVRMDDIGKVTGGLTKNAKRAELPLRKAYLRVANVYSNEVRLEEVLEIGLTESEYEKTKLTYGDLLIVEGNGSIDQIGRVAMWKDELPECSHQNHLIRWRRSNLNIVPEFILAYLLSPAGRTQIISAASSTSGLHTLSVSKISALELNIPPVEEQSEIVRRVEKLFAFADRLEERLTQAQAAVQKLTPALLAKAFRGELVPQDPNDEPASELLKRLQKSRTDSSKPSRARKPRTRKSP